MELSKQLKRISTRVPMSLILAEAAMIAGLFQSPVAYDPNINPDRTEARRQTVV